MSANKNTRATIFKNISAALDAHGPKALREQNANARINARERGPIPLRGQKTGSSLIDEFVSEAIRINGEIINLKSISEIPGAVMTAAQKNAPNIRLAPHPVLNGLNWDQSVATINTGPADPSDDAGVSVAKMAVAETGTLVLLSGPKSPVTINFLPDVHIVVLFSEDILPTYEDVWDKIRKDNSGVNVMPRTVNWITGPSRTADIEQSILLGAHGPRRLVILLIDGKKTSTTNR
ncbi:MAG: LUD domain-containing protein [Rhodospirillaceae bacterium]|nr:LUD domain-containing protein [Rhodospirillaceae bacterium]